MGLNPHRGFESRPLRSTLHDPIAPVAQLDRASVYGTEGQRFESSRARYKTPAKQALYTAVAPGRASALGTSSRHRLGPGSCAGRSGDSVDVADPHASGETLEASAQHAHADEQTPHGLHWPGFSAVDVASSRLQ